MKTRRICCNCGSMVKKETKLKDYPFVCTKCDENLFYFETLPVRKMALFYLYYRGN